MRGHWHSHRQCSLRTHRDHTLPTLVYDVITLRNLQSDADLELCASFSSARFLLSYYLSPVPMHPRVLVIGGAGALGRAVIFALSKAGCAALSADIIGSPSARGSILLPRALPLPDTVSALRAALSGAPPLAGIVVTAGAWEGGGSGAVDFSDVWSRMSSANLDPALAGAALASGGLLAPGGALVFIGASAALVPQPGMLAYGLCKSAIHTLARALDATDGGLPSGARAFAVLPRTLHTPANSAAMPDADTSTWTPVEDVANEVAAWVLDAEKRPSQTLSEVTTVGGVSSWKSVT